MLVGFKYLSDSELRERILRLWEDVSLGEQMSLLQMDMDALKQKPVGDVEVLWIGQYKREIRIVKALALVAGWDGTRQMKRRQNERAESGDESEDSRAGAKGIGRGTHDP